MFPLMGAMPYGSSSYTTTAPQMQPNGGGLLGGIPGGSSIPGMLSGGYNTAMGTGSAFGPEWLGPAGFFAALIGLGKNIESKNPNNGLGMGLLGGLAPSGAQIAKDPMGMGLPTLLGMPFLTPFTSSKAAQATKPEWQSLFKLGT